MKLQSKHRALPPDRALQGVSPNLLRSDSSKFGAAPGLGGAERRYAFPIDGTKQSMKKARRATSPNRAGLPQALKGGIESLSGLDLSDVRVHANSDKPSQLDALAFAQGSDIHAAPGQEKHLPHEAWHAVQQPPGRGKPTMQAKEGVAVNDDASIEREADSMGAAATESAPQRTDATRTTPK